MYLPLIDKPPTDYSTMVTSLVEAIRLTEETCQPYTVFTYDQQLYKIVVDIKLTYSEKFVNVIPRLGGMHFLMSFVGSIGCFQIFILMMAWQLFLMILPREASLQNYSPIV